MPASIFQPLPPGKKAIEAARLLAELANRLGNGAKLPTVRELRKQLQISQHTLEVAFKGLEARGLLVRKQGSGIYVSSLARTRRVGVVTQRRLLEAGEQDPFFPLLLNSLRRTGSQRGHLVTTYAFDTEHGQDESGSMQLDLDIQNSCVDALIVTGLGIHTDQVTAPGLPCVFLSENPRRVPRVGLDLKLLVTEGVRALVRCGRRRICLAYAIARDQAAQRLELELYQRVLEAEGAQVDFDWQMPFDGSSGHLYPLEGSRQFHKRWENPAARPDGLLSLNDQYTAGMLHAAEVLGVRMPQELVVASHANKGLDLFTAAEVIRLEYDSAQVAQLLLQIVDDLLDGKPSPQAQQMIRPWLHWPKEWEAGRTADTDKSEISDGVGITTDLALNP